MTTDVDEACRALLNSLMAAPWGQVSPSPYETGRLVALAPWLDGHNERVEYLVRTQRPDGGWGGPDGYGLVPTLSTVDALLAGASTGQPTGAVDRGLARLVRGFGSTRNLPDMPAMDLIVAQLTESINKRLAVDEDRRSIHLGLPVGMSDARWSALRTLLRRGDSLDVKIAHALEAGGATAHGSSAVRLAMTGSIGASAAATAAWLGPRRPVDGHPARRFLETVVHRHDLLAPCAMPITVLERAWVLSTLTRVGVIPVVPAGMLADLEASVGEGGAATSPGLPADADTTAAVVYTLARLGRPASVDPLWRFEGADHFHTWPDEGGSSTTVNAHVLEALGEAGSGVRERAAMTKVTTWLLERQETDGGWSDRWHASPFYATFSVVAALHRFGGARTSAAIARAVEWVLANQRHDGSWGRWSGTVEESAYAVQTLELARGVGRPGVDSAILRGRRPVLAALESGVVDDSPLWHDKDLYQPYAVVRAAMLAVAHLGQVWSVAPLVRRSDTQRLSRATQRC